MRALLAATLLAATAAGAVDTPPSDALPDLAPIRAQVYAGEYAAAAEALASLSASVRHADIFNLLGFSLRNLGRYDEAAKAYADALYYDPSHRPALEYQGELFIAIGDLEAARGNVGLLTLFCPQGCDELDKLNAALAEAEATETHEAAKEGSHGGL